MPRPRLHHQYFFDPPPEYLEGKRTYLKKPASECRYKRDWQTPKKLFYDATLPDMPMVFRRPDEYIYYPDRFSDWLPSNSGPQTMEYEYMEEFMDTTTPPFMNRNSGILTLDALFLKLPLEIRYMVYEEIFGGPAKFDCSRGSEGILRDGSVGIARRIPNPDLENPINGCGIYDQRRILSYFKPEEYVWLESCARRMEKMNPALLGGFMDYFFRHTVLDLKEELAVAKDRRRSSTIFPEGSQLWFNMRTHLHTSIRNISLDLFVRGHVINPSFNNFCRDIADKLDLDTVIIWVSIPRQEANQFLAGRFPKRWLDTINIVRKMKVKRSLEIRSFIQKTQRTWWEVEEEKTELGAAKDQPKMPNDLKVFIVECKRLDEMILKTLLPNTLRDKEIDDTTETVRETKKSMRRKKYDRGRILGDGIRRWRRMQPSVEVELSMGEEANKQAVTKRNHEVDGDGSQEQKSVQSMPPEEAELPIRESSNKRKREVDDDEGPSQKQRNIELMLSEGADLPIREASNKRKRESNDDDDDDEGPSQRQKRV